MADGTDNTPPLPDWWKVPKSDPIASVSFQALCLISIGSLSPEQLWASRMNDDEWERHRQKIVRRLSNIIIVAGLVLASSAVFVSTQAPLTSLFPYTISACYILALGSFGHALGSLICGFIVIHAYEVCDRLWASKVFTGSRIRLCYTLAFISSPAIYLASSIILLTLSLLVACYASGVWWLQLFAAMEISVWTWPLVVLSLLYSTRLIEVLIAQVVTRNERRLQTSSIPDHPIHS